MLRLPVRLTVALATALTFGAAASAGAAEFYVDAATGTANPSCTQATPCSTIQQGVDAATADAAATPDTVHVTPGSYAGFSDNAPTVPVTVAGSSTTAATSIYSLFGPLVSLSGGATGSLTLRDISLTVPDNAAPATAAIVAGAGALTLENVQVDVAHRPGTGADNTSAVITQGATLTARRLDVRVHTDKPALDLTGAATLTDSYAQSDRSTSPTVNVTGAASYALVRSQVAKTAAGHIGYAIQATTVSNAAPPTVRLDSALVRGGEFPLFSNQPTTMTSSTWTLQNATVDSVGSTSSGGGVIYSTHAASDPLSFTADSSILVDKIFAFPQWAASCTYTDVAADSVAGSGGTNSCVPTGPNNTSGEAALFPGPDSYEPKYESRVVDTGNPSPPSGSSATDLQGTARLLPGHGGCIGLRDRGAVEHTGSVGAPPSAAIDGPAALVAGAAGTFSGAAGDGVSFAWSADDGGTGAAQTFGHAFTAVGAHSVTLTASRPGGCTATTTKAVNVTAAAAPGTGGGGAGTPTSTVLPPGPSTPPTPALPPGKSPAAKDTVAPKITLVALGRRAITVRVSEAVTLTIKLCPKAARRCTRRTFAVKGAGKVRRALQLPRGSVTVSLTAVDAAGNRGTAKKTRRLR